MVKAKKILAGAFLALCLCGFVTFLSALLSVRGNPAYGQQPISGSRLGITQIVMSAAAGSTSYANLSGGTAGLGASTPCRDLLLTIAVSGTGSPYLLAGTGSASCTYPLYPTPSSGTAAQPASITLPVDDLSQLWFSLYNVGSGTSATVSGGTINATYRHW